MEMIGVSSLGAAFGLPQIDPVGGFVSRPLKAGYVHKGLSQVHGMAIDLLPFLAKSSETQSQNLGSQVFDLDPGWNQKADIGGDQVQIFALGVLNPANKLIPGSDFPSRTAPGQTGNDLISEHDRLADVLSHDPGESQVVVALKEIFPDQLGVA